MSFADWLRAEGYAASTISLTLAAAEQVRTWTADGRELPDRLRSPIKRMEQFGLSQLFTPKEARAAQGVLNRPPPSRLQRSKAREARRRRVAPSINDAKWEQIQREFQAGAMAGDARDAVLFVMSQTALRIGDVLRLSRQRLSGGIRSGVIRVIQKGDRERQLPVEGAPEAWAVLHAATEGYPTVAHAVAPNGDGSPLGGGAAYQAVRRRLKKLGGAFDVDGRVHTHRLRRTLAVQTIRATGSVDDARQLLGHSSLNMALTYIDEEQPDRVAELQKILRKKRNGATSESEG